MEQLRNRLPLIAQFTKFGVVGVSNTVVDFGFLNLLHFVFLIPVLPANTVSFSLAVGNSFIWNKYWTFKNRETKNMRGQFAQFLIVSLIGLAINNTILFLILSQFDSLSPLLLNMAKLSASLVSMVWNFTAYKKLVF